MQGIPALWEAWVLWPFKQRIMTFEKMGNNDFPEA